jgi:hypothetical protein
MKSSKSLPEHSKQKVQADFWGILLDEFDS